MYYLTERQARKEIEERNRLQKTLAYKEKLQKEEQMRDAASKARDEKNRLLMEASNPESGKEKELNEEEIMEKKERDQLRYIRKREIEREKRIDVWVFSKGLSIEGFDRIWERRSPRLLEMKKGILQRKSLWDKLSPRRMN